MAPVPGVDASLTAEYACSEYAYIVPANARYLPGLNAIINSLDIVGNRHDLVVLSWHLPPQYVQAARQADLSFRVVFQELTDEEVTWLGETEALVRKRYALPASLPYQAFCILDADMFFGDNVERYLEIAHKTGLVLGCGLEQKRHYSDPNHQYPPGSGHYLVDPAQPNVRDLACAPLFVGRGWISALKRSYDIVNDHAEGDGRFLAPDMDGLNICLLEAGSFDRTVPLSQHTWTGLHECMMKAHTRAVLRHGRLMTEDDEEINVVHGQFWSRNWRRWQIENQFRMIDHEFSGLASYRAASQRSFDLLCDTFKRISCAHKIDINGFLSDIPTAPPGTQDVMDLE